MLKQSILQINSFTTLNNTLLVLLFLSIKGGDTGGGALECQGGYEARPKIHVIQ